MSLIVFQRTEGIVWIFSKFIDFIVSFQRKEYLYEYTINTKKKNSHKTEHYIIDYPLMSHLSCFLNFWNERNKQIYKVGAINLIRSYYFIDLILFIRLFHLFTYLKKYLFRKCKYWIREPYIGHKTTFNYN